MQAILGGFCCAKILPLAYTGDRGEDMKDPGKRPALYQYVGMIVFTIFFGYGFIWLLKYFLENVRNERGSVLVGDGIGTAFFGLMFVLCLRNVLWIKKARSQPRS